ncbi:trypsin-like serine protease [Piscinibacter sp. XHJ-5]|uniref:trypsin-like serine peptidase n=1 Tax=Piscinibacter sp. XHJ-5 TaxID=3037797 RepID=UPI00245281CA|nr:trypsin-like serine protease [Piscinibacter sp. XHJ-5]
MNQATFFAVSALAWGMSAAPASAEIPASADLIGGVPDSSTPARNAIVFINSAGAGCTGTLVAPDVVVTSGHCIPTFGRTPIANGRWERMAPGVSSVVSFGPNPAAPIATAHADWINYSGTDDIVLIGLRARVPASVAVPRKIVYDRPADLDAADYLYHSGYGAGSPVRQVGYSREYRPFRSLADPAQADNYFCFNDIYGSLGPGDSGSPVLWGGPEGAVMGVYQGTATCKTALEHPSAPVTGENDGAVMTFGKGNTFGTKVNVSQWLKRNVQRSFCSRNGSTASVSDGGAHVKLMNWWSAARADNFATTQAGWAGCFTDWDYEVDHDGYRYFRHEGWVPSPTRPQPYGTQPLHVWWNSTSRDNATTMSAVPIAGGAWTRGPLLGYVYTSSTRTTGLVPLRLWYSSSRQDYLTTTSTVDYTSSGYVRVGTGIGTGGAGVIGYIKRSDLVR